MSRPPTEAAKGYRPARPEAYQHNLPLYCSAVVVGRSFPGPDSQAEHDGGIRSCHAQSVTTHTRVSAPGAGDLAPCTAPISVSARHSVEIGAIDPISLA